MGKKNLTSDLQTAHLNSLNKTLEAIEVQLTAVKTVLKLAAQGKVSDETADTEVDEDESEDEDDAPTTKKDKKGESSKNQDSEDDDDADSEEDETDDETNADESEDDDDGENAEPTLKDCIKALRVYQESHSRKKAIAMLKKMGVDSVQELKPKKYKALLALLA